MSESGGWQVLFWVWGKYLDQQCHCLLTSPSGVVLSLFCLWFLTLIFRRKLRCYQQLFSACNLYYLCQLNDWFPVGGHLVYAKPLVYIHIEFIKQIVILMVNYITSKVNHMCKKLNQYLNPDLHSLKSCPSNSETLPPCCPKCHYPITQSLEETQEKELEPFFWLKNREYLHQKQ